MNENIQKIKCDWPEGQNRVETGAVQFNDDWPSLHIRGDNAAYLSMCWQQIRDSLPEEVQNKYIFEILQLDSFLGKTGTIQSDVIKQ